MRILYVHRTQGRGVEGVHIRGMVDAMRQAGHDVRLLGPPGVDPYRSPEPRDDRSLAARFARVAPELAFELAEIAYDRRLEERLAAIAEDFAPELIYERYAFFGGAASETARRLDIPHLLEVNYSCDDPLVRRRSRLLMPWALRVERRVFSAASVLAVVSSNLEQRAIERGAAAERIVLTPNAVDRRWWDNAHDIMPAPMPDSFADLPLTGFVGGFYPWHGVEQLVTAVCRCREERLETALLLVGEGPERERIMDMIRDRGLEALAFLPGMVEHVDLGPWIAAMDICVMPSSNDYGSPMKVFEYMTLGKAVLAPDLPPLRDVIVSGESGQLFEPAGGTGGNGNGVTDNLSAGLAKLLADVPHRARLGAAARETVGRRHTWQENLRRVFRCCGQPDPFPDGGDAATPVAESKLESHIA